MVKNIKVVLNSDGVKQLLKSDEIMDFMDKKAHELLDNCDVSPKSKYEVERRQKGKTRGAVSIVTHSKDTFFRNMATNELLKGLNL